MQDGLLALITSHVIEEKTKFVNTNVVGLLDLSEDVFLLLLFCQSCMKQGKEGVNR